MMRLTTLIAGLCLLHCATAGKVCARPRGIESAVFRPGKVLYEPRDVVTYSCIPGYERETGNDKAVCSTLGNWEHATLRCKAKQCPKPGPLDNGQAHYKHLTYESVMWFSCNKGYTLRGANESECLENGKWSKEMPVCEVVTCPPPPLPKSAEIQHQTPKSTEIQHQTPKSTEIQPHTPKSTEIQPHTPKSTDTQHQTPKSTEIQHQTPKSTEIQPQTPKSTEIQHQTPKSTEIQPQTPKSTEIQPQTPKSTEIQPQTRKSTEIQRHTPLGKNVSIYQDVVAYRCLQNLVLIGNENVTCTENGTWSAAPECRDVKCNRPTEITNGYMSFALYRKYNYKESVSYGCNPPYALDGPRISFCDKDGDWSQKPACRAPCHVTTPKATVLYNGRRTRVDEIAGQQIQHGDILTYFCKNKEQKCAYTVQSQCRGGNFTAPACYKKPGTFSLFSTDPSKMTPCAQEAELR